MADLSIYRSSSMALNTSSINAEKEELDEEFHRRDHPSPHSQMQPPSQPPSQPRKLRQSPQPRQHLQHLHTHSHPHSPLQQQQQYQSSQSDNVEYTPRSYDDNSSPISSSSDFNLAQVPTRSTFENQNMSRYSHSNSSHRSTPQPRYSEDYIKQKELEFLESDEQGWIHGYDIPYSIITFEPLQEDTTKKKLVRSYDQNMFAPKLVLDEIEHAAFSRKNSAGSQSLSTVHSHGPPTEDQLKDISQTTIGDVFYNEDYPGAFAGYLSIPRVTYNVPNGYRSSRHQKLCQDVPKLIYSTHLNHDNLTYVFGGLYVNKASNFKHLGLPLDVDLARVSVKFPYQLPPFVNTKLMTNPFMQSYPNFFMFNAQRGSVTCLDTAQMEEYPSGINAMTGTQVSKRHFFFYGGWSIVDRSVSYNPEMDRWLIHKDFVLNEDGYIVDTVTLKFTKVKLSGKENSFITLGRMGNGICANVYDGGEYMNSFPRAPSPPIFTATTVPYTAERAPGTRTGTAASSLASGVNNGVSHSKSPNRELSFATTSHTSVNLKFNNLKNEDAGSFTASNASKHSSLHRIVTTNSVESQSSSENSGKLPPPHIPPPVLPSQLQNNKHQPPSIGKLRINPNLPAVNNSPSATTGTPATTTSTTTATPSTTLLQTPSSSTTKMMGNVLAKSTRIFHRHRHTLSDGSPGGSGSSGTAGGTSSSNTNNQSPSQDSGSLSSSRSRIRSPHPLKYSYSQRHKEHRSKSPNPGTTNSRPGSRTVSPNLVATKAVPPGQLNTPTTTSSTINTVSTTSTAGFAGSVSNLINESSTPTPTTHTPSIKSENSSPTPNPVGVPVLPSQSQPNQSSSSPQIQYPFPSYILDGETYKSNRRVNISNNGRFDDLEEVASIVSEEDPSGIKKHHEGNENVLFNQASSIACVVVFVYGGFIMDNIGVDGIQHFRATSDLLKIELSTRGNDEKRGLGGFSFLPEALVSSVGTPKDGHFDISVEDGEWPEARGYFASVLIDHQDQSLEENCAFEVAIDPSCSLKPGLANQIPPNSSSSFQLPQIDTPAADEGNGASFQCGSVLNESEISQAEQYLSSKALLVQGGCDDSNNFFSDFWLFVFQTGKWERLNTYVYDYFNVPLDPNEDDDLNKYTPQTEVETPELKPAELRGCHHTAMYYKNEERDYLFFIGGLRQDYLRNFDKVPYKSDKFDVARFARFPLCTDNSIFIRVSVLNIQTQTWRFMKYHYDVKHTITEKYVNQIMNIPGLMHARLCNLGGMISMSEKNIIIGHGFALFSPEQKAMLEEMKKTIPFDEFLFGGHIMITFPGL
ncbi:uncharacterized protein SPAPADRAFT_48431 [Spathaspora passalidarum NRRL Y-27907]|uniref:Uncharacterized protein n=1 Tax=Spathaspora passalidarum (strain NRRL Y-27907 / 11-Y1) TaxID=619300 RepID=G3AH07_SPAPN|nr:uncharacterized protein SPAPADRAFT_48431 [Spathaspora passalidarum NRRL Y-27907]EGW35437.1 hypothetical protein SPAPADRAFT_48431 [Spathaspora passalidarum NRRL Y-27907]